MIVADTSWISSLRDPMDSHHEPAVAINDSMGDEPVMIAAVTLAECLVAPAKLGGVELAEALLRDAFEVDEIDDGAPRRWAVRRAATGLRLPDAIVLETALHRQARAVATFDTRLAEHCRAAGLIVFGGPPGRNP